MRRIRIGKDIIIRWTVTTNGEPDPLHGRILKLMLHHAFMPDMEIPFVVDQSVANRIVATFRGVSQESIGTYRLTLWENYGLDGQTVVDYCNAFELVNTTCEEGGEDVEGLDTETVELEGSDIETGIPGADGMSAYELFKKYNPDSPLTEQEYAEAPIEAAQGVDNAINEVNETNKVVTEAENARVEAENGRVDAESKREESETQRDQAEASRVEAETARANAEIDRASAENIRISNEASRVNAETARVQSESERASAESKRAEAELTREFAETKRETQEKSRKDSETLRVAAENARVSAEQGRVIAENERVEAEREREQSVEQALTDMSTAIDNATTATSYANTAAGSANAAAQAANTAADKADTAADRADALADNPPKIVEVEGAKYWATWNEALGQYVVSENRADVGDAVLFSPQTLTPQQQEQARANIGSAPKYYDKNGFVISPLGLKVIGLRYIGFKEVSGDTTCYILTVSRCLKFDFKTFEVFWDVAVPEATDSWHKSSVSMRIIGDEVYIAQANWNIVGTGFNLIRLNDTDGSPIEQKEIPVAIKYTYSNILTAGDILLTSSAVYALDTNLKKIVKCDIETLEITELSDESSDLSSNSTRNLPWWITNEYGERELVIVNFLPKVNKIHLTRDNGSTIEITVSGTFNISSYMWCIYRIDLVSNLLYIQSGTLIYEAKIIKEDDAHYTAELFSITNITLKYRDFCRNSLVNYNIKQSNFILNTDNSSFMMPFDLTGKKDSAYFVSNKTGIALIADHICASDTDSLSNIDIWAGI